MTEFPTFERLADQNQRETAKERERRKLGQVVGIVFFLLCILEAILLASHSSRSQKQVERDLAELQLPSLAVQEGYTADHQSRKGYAEKVFASTLRPREVCGFYEPKLQDSGWSLKHKDCEPINSETDIRSNRVLLEFGKAHTVCRVFYFGRTGIKSKYSVRVEWLD